MLSGTSADGLDVAVADLEAVGGVVTLRPVHAETTPLPEVLRRQALAVLPPATTTAAALCRLDTDFGRFCADAAAGVVERHGGDLIASLGQTVFHWVEDGAARGTLQVGQPAWIAEATGVPVVSDLRARDVAAGGHGAPLASTLDALWLRGPQPRAALNLGGIANLTVVPGPGGPVVGYDTGPANCLLDLVAARASGGSDRYDADGRLAAAGRVDRPLLDRMLADPYFAQKPPKSTGRERFTAGWLDQALAGARVTDADLAATLVELTARSVADACRRPRGHRGARLRRRHAQPRPGRPATRPARAGDAADHRRARPPLGREGGLPGGPARLAHLARATRRRARWHRQRGAAHPRADQPRRRAAAAAAACGRRHPAGGAGMTARLGVAAALVGGRLLPGDVTVADGRIDAVGVSPAGRSGIAAPGLVDVQVNGYAGVDVAAADPDQLTALRRWLARDGVTAVAPTIITGDRDDTFAALRRLAAADRDLPGAARLLGTHVEGPWLSPSRLGTHPPQHRRDPEPELVAQLTEGLGVALLTLAPELPGALEAVRALTRAGVGVLVGHSDATAAQARAAFDAGAVGLTHLFNAMAPLHHREPGPAGVALTRPGVTVGVIADGHHLAPEVVRLAFTAAPGRVALVTDATAASGMPDGDYVLGGVALTLAGGAVRNRAGALAGSAATLAGCVREAVRAGVGVAEALHAATGVPADLVRRPDLGRLRPGGTADVTVLDDGLTVRRVLVHGEELA